MAASSTLPVCWHCRDIESNADGGSGAVLKVEVGEEDAMPAILEDGEREFKQWKERYDFEVADCRRYFGEWDLCDPVVWAILRVVQAQNDLARAIDLFADHGADARGIEQAIAERLKAITALQQATGKHPRGDL
jgi:hypothetical protein